jgi:hypothetical protein
MSQTDRVLGALSSLAFKAPVRAATTANITLSGLQTIDGIALVADERVLVKNQTDQTENGIYIADTSGWERAVDFDSNSDVATGTLVLVTAGTIAAGIVYRLTTLDPITIDTSSLTFSVYDVGNAITLPVAIAQGGTGGASATASLANLGVVEVTGVGGTANAITGTIDALVTAFRTNQLFLLTPTAANTGATTLTLTPSGSGALAAKNIFSQGAVLLGGELQASVPTVLLYDGTQLNIIGGLFPSNPQTSKSVNYTTVLSDANKHLLHPTADNNPRTFTVASNATVPYPIGTVITFVNEINTLTIAITSDTLALAGTASTGSRTLAAMGIATALKKTSTSWIISGVGLT